MSLRDENERKWIVEAYKKRIPRFQHNTNLLDIFEGNLLPYVESELKKQLSDQSYQACAHRIPPINILKKIVDKTSTIYSPPPVRRIKEGTGTAGDSELLAKLEAAFDINAKMRLSLETFNLTKAQILQPYVKDGEPGLRSIPTDAFFVLSNDPVDPKRITHVVTFDASGGEEVKFAAYTAEEFLIFNQEGDVDSKAMNALANLDGVNPFQVIPFAYGADSRFKLEPTTDTDVLRMVILIPLLLADLNFAAMFQAFCIMYGINVNSQNLKMSPNAFWEFKTEEGLDPSFKPEVGILKPTADISEIMSMIQSELALWLNSKGIRPGAVGQLDKDAFASGVSKLIDEMDTVELRKTLVEIFTRIETELWEKVMHEILPVWEDQGLTDPKLGKFSAKAKIEIVFPPQLPITNRGQVVKDLKEEIDAKLTTRKRALQVLNPSLSDRELDSLIAEIDDEGKKNEPPPAPPPTPPKEGDPPPPKEEDPPEV